MIIGRGSLKEVTSISIKSMQKQYVLCLDLASLSSIQLGNEAFYGKDVDTCSLDIQSEAKAVFQYRYS